MSRPIDADVLKDRINFCVTKGLGGRIAFTFIHMIDEQPTVEPMQWIPCEVRLPEKRTEVIYSLENHFVSTGYMTDRGFDGSEMELHWEDLESGAMITPEAWMPLPAPYKGR